MLNNLEYPARGQCNVVNIIGKEVEGTHELYYDCFKFDVKTIYSLLLLFIFAHLLLQMKLCKCCSDFCGYVIVLDSHD